MHRIRVIFVAAAAALGLVLAGCAGGGASGGSSRSAGQVVDDATLTARVKTEIAKEQGLADAASIDVTTNRGTVQLSGFVDSREQAQRAEEIARSVTGVQTVKNDLRLTTRKR